MVVTRVVTRVVNFHRAVVIQLTPAPQVNAVLGKNGGWIGPGITGSFGSDILNKGGKACGGSVWIVTAAVGKAGTETLRVCNYLTLHPWVSNDRTIPPTFLLERFCCVKAGKGNMVTQTCPPVVIPHLG